MNQTKIPKRISSALVNSLSAGVVPRIGLEYIAVGRKLEIESVLRELGNVAEGGAAFKLITGRYGSGKSFLIQILRNYAMDRDFVVADADLSPERRLVGTKGQGLGTYRELMTHLSTRTRPDGGALEAVLQKWFASLQQQAMAELGLRPDDEKLPLEVERRIFEVTGNMEHMVHGFDFARVLSAYWNGYKTSDDELKQNALRWLRGEFSTKTEARKTLGVGVIIDDNNWYDYMKLWAEFMAKIGYKGLLLFIDEGVNLYKITNTVSRQSNYEKLLTIFNDTMQGKAQHLGIFLGGTPKFVEDQRRGLFSYDALRSRLVAGRFGEGAGMLHYAGPILKLEMLSHAEILVLLEKLRDLHASHYGYTASLNEQQLTRFMESELGRMGADALLTTREVVRDFMDLLNTLHQYPERTFDELLPDVMGRASQSDGAFAGLGGGLGTGAGSGLSTETSGVPAMSTHARDYDANVSRAPVVGSPADSSNPSVVKEAYPNSVTPVAPQKPNVSDRNNGGGSDPVRSSAAPAPFRPRGGGFENGENVEGLRVEPNFYGGGAYESAGHAFRSGASDSSYAPRVEPERVHSRSAEPAPWEMGNPSTYSDHDQNSEEYSTFAADSLAGMEPSDCDDASGHRDSETAPSEYLDENRTSENLDDILAELDL